jgi:hypothetical protein
MNKLSRRIFRSFALLLAAASFSGCCLHGGHFGHFGRDWGHGNWAPHHGGSRHCR